MIYCARILLNFNCTVVVNDSVTRQANWGVEQEELFEFIRNDDHYQKYYNGMFVHILFKTDFVFVLWIGQKDIDLQERKSM